jgi:MFS family permease
MSAEQNARNSRARQLAAITIPLAALGHWLDRNMLALGREMRLSYLPPLMIYVAYGIQGLTAIVGTFFVKDYLGLSASFLAALAFWAGIPWVLKMPLGHLVDLIWRYKAGLVYLGAAMLSASLLTMIGLLTERAAMAAVMPVEAWYVLAALLAPTGYVIQDVVADAMTVEAVPRVDAEGQPVDPAQRKLMHTTMQTLGRVAIIGGGVLVALANIYLFAGVEAMSEADKVATYVLIYQIALAIPIISVLGVALAGTIKRRDLRRLMATGLERADAQQRLERPVQITTPNWWILGGSLVFVVFTLGMGLTDVPYNQEIIFAGSMAIVLFLMTRLMRALDADARLQLLGTALIIFVFRAMPTPGPGQTWWMIDELAFDQQFLSVLSLIGSTLALFGLFIFRRFMAEHSIARIVVFLTLLSGLLYLPIIGMYFGLHEWTAAVTAGIVDARFIAIVDTALESPLGQVAMVPMLAWIANSAPDNLKATFFAVMASFSNLALSAGQLGTKYLNQVFLVTREVRDPVSGVLSVPADYGELGALMITALLIGLTLPLVAVALVRLSRLRSA